MNLLGSSNDDIYVRTTALNLALELIRGGHHQDGGVYIPEKLIKWASYIEKYILGDVDKEPADIENANQQTQMSENISIHSQLKDACASCYIGDGPESLANQLIMEFHKRGLAIVRS